MGYGRSHQGIRSGGSSSERNGGEQGRTVATGSHGRTSLEPATAAGTSRRASWMPCEGGHLVKFGPEKALTPRLSCGITAVPCSVEEFARTARKSRDKGARGASLPLCGA